MQNMSVEMAGEHARPGGGAAADISGEGVVVSAVASGSGLEDWPPVSYAQNDRVLVWWLPEYDEVLRELVAEYQWGWRGAALPRLESLIPQDVLRSWRDSDPQCQVYSWYNVLDVFAAARAKQLGFTPRLAQEKACLCCSRRFLESHLPHGLIARVGVDSIDVCPACLRQALQATGSRASTPDAVIAVLQVLSAALERPPKASDLAGRMDLRSLTPAARAAVVQALRVKPAAARVRELFGSWDAAQAQAATSVPVPLPPYQPGSLASSAESEFTSSDPARYRELLGPLPEVLLDAGHDEGEYYREITSLIGSGYLSLAEAALTELCSRPHEMGFDGLLAQVYGQTGRTQEARAVLRAANYSPGADGGEPDLGPYSVPRDVRTITSGPAFYELLPSLPRGNACFVLVGGPMQYVDRRGEHDCVTGAPPPGGALAGLAESVARMSAMVDGEPWIQAATKAGQAIIASLIRSSADPARLYGHAIAYVTSHFRAAVKSLTGSLPRKVSPDTWGVAPVGKSRWSYGRDADHYFYNACSGFTLMTTETAPAVCIWAWPDRSDGCLQAFLDTLAAGAPQPVFVILPDVPAYRDFARRYVRAEQMTLTQRTYIEDCLYRSPSDMVNKRGYVLAAEFAPRLVVLPDGTEYPGDVLAGGLSYLDAHHTLRLSIRDVLGDGLLRQAALTAAPDPRPFAVAATGRADMVLWYRQLPESGDPGILLRPFRPRLLDAALPA